MIRLLAFADAPQIPTGFGRVVDHVLYPLVDSGEYDVHLCAINYHGDMPDLDRYPYQYYLPQYSPARDVYGVGRVKDLIGRLQPDVVWILNDLPIIEEFYSYRDNAEALATVPVVTYSPVDGDPFPASYLDGIRQASIPVVYTEYAKEVIRDLDRQLGDRLEVIGHGVDSDEFWPMGDDKKTAKRRARAALNKESGTEIPDDWFIVLRIDKNQERKQWPSTIEAFAMFAQDKPEARLWLHTPLVIDGGYDIPALIERYGIGDQVMHSGLGPQRLGVPIEKLNQIYNAADCHLSTTAGGGWELSTHEAQAAGTPTLITDYAAMSYVGQAGILLSYTYTYTACRNTTQYAMVDIEAVVDGLNTMYCGKGYDLMRWRCMRWAKEHTWETQQVPERFDALFRESMLRHKDLGGEEWHG